MKSVIKRFEARSWQRFINHLLGHCPDSLLILRGPKGRRPYAEMVQAALSGESPETISVEKIVWPGRVKTALYYLHIKTLDQLAKMSVSDLTKQRNFGERSLRAIMDVLHRHGLSLRDESPMW